MPDTYQSDQDYAFTKRMDSSVEPRFLSDGAYFYGLNTTARAGIVQTRPGFATTFNLPPGNLQGFTTFRPTGGKVNLVFVVDGKAYASPAPFTYYERIPNIQFYKRSKIITFASCVQSTDYTPQGLLYQRTNPRRVLIMQDQNTRAAYWDGGESAHIDPTPSYTTDPDSGEIITLPGTDGTPIGLHMAWVENRLWVARGNRVFASDIGNPLKFTETQYIAEGRYFTMPEDVTGMIQPSSGQPLIIFGERTLTFLKAYTQRANWIDDSEFQRTEYGVGCIAPRSIINKLGLIWWYSPQGWTNLNYALQSFNDSQINYLDRPMQISKRNLSVDKTLIAAESIEDYTFISVPSGGKYNEHTWVYDSYVVNPGWDGVWTGVRPVQWSKAVVDGTERIWCASKDSDGVNRIWEAMQPDRSDNGEPITCALFTRDYNRVEGNKSQLLKRFGYFDLFAKEVNGVVDIAGWFTGTNGPLTKVLERRLSAKANATDEDTDLSGGVTTMQDLIPQVRHIKSETHNNNSDDVTLHEISHRAGVDYGFQIALQWSGELGVSSLRCFYEAGVDDYFEGEWKADETTETAVNAFGFSASGSVPSTLQTPSYDATATYTGTVDGDTVTATASSYSNISSANATRKATGKAKLSAWGAYVASGSLLTEGGEELTTEDGTVITL